MGETVEIYQAKDFLFSKPDKPEYEDLINSEGRVYGYKMINMINVCDQFSFIPAIQCPHREYAMLAFGKYPVMKFLLKPVGRMIIKTTKNT